MISIKRLLAIYTIIILIMAIIPFDTASKPEIAPEPFASLTAVQNGDWDDVNTWGGADFPNSGDEATIPSGYDVVIKGPETCGDITINWGGNLTFDGQGNTVIAQMTLDDGATLTNNGRINGTGLGTTGYAKLIGTSMEVFSGTQPDWAINENWHFDEINFTMDLSWGNFAMEIDLDGDITVQAVTFTNANNKFEGNDNWVYAYGDWNSEIVSSYLWETNFNAKDDLNITHKVVNNRFDHIVVDEGATLTCLDALSCQDTLTVNGIINGTKPLYLGYNGGTPTPLIMGSSGDISDTSAVIFYLQTTGTTDGFFTEGCSYFVASNGNPTLTMNGDITTGTCFYFYKNNPSMYAKLNTNGNNITTGTYFQIGGSDSAPGILDCDGSIMTIGTDVTIFGGLSYVDYGASIWNISGDFTDNSVDGSRDEGTSIIFFNGTGIQDFYSNHTYHNITINSEGTFTFHRDNTNISELYCDSGTEIEIGGNITVSDDFTLIDSWVNSTDGNMRYIFVPYSARTITGTEFNNVTLIGIDPLANETSDTITIDGILSESAWTNDANYYFLDGADAQDFDLYTMMDDTNVYIGIEGTQAVLEASDYNEIYFDTWNYGDTSPTNNSYKRLNVTSANATVYYEGNAGSWNTVVKPSGWDAKCWKNGNSIIYEYKIPLVNLSVSSNFDEVGDIIGFGMMDYNDKAGTKTWTFFPDDYQVGSISDDHRQDPSDWGDLSHNWALPEIANVSDQPDPQITGNYVNITADITDNIGVGSVMVNITFPDTSTSNVSMTAGAGDEYFYNTTYAQLGTHTYIIYANDSAELLNQSSSATFLIQSTDSDPPEIANISDQPDPQNQNGYVNITADITDATGFYEIKVNITFPDTSTSNVSMVQGAVNEWFYNTTYTSAGQYSYYIWANDTNDYGNTSSAYYFNITDTELPELANLTETPDPQLRGSNVNVTIDITDNIDVDTAFLNVTHPDSSYTNTSMAEGTSNEWYLNTSYSQKGMHIIVIWSNDTIGNMNNSITGYFNITDELPQFTSPDASPSPQLRTGYVNITVTITDDLSVNNAYVIVDYPDLTSFNSSLVHGSGNLWYYNTTYSLKGIHYYNFSAKDNYNQWNTSIGGSFLMTDDNPELMNLQANPSSQIRNSYINITVNVTDDLGITSVYCNVTYPDLSYTNTSMTAGIGDEWFSNTTYSQKGNHNVTIWALDNNGQHNSTSQISLFTMTDNPPEFQNLTVVPNPQLRTNTVNISCNITDDLGVNGAWINITYPNATTSNQSMVHGSGNLWYFNTTYNIKGQHNYTIWANDTYNQPNSTYSTFNITDALPELRNLTVVPNLQIATNYVNISVNVTDDLAVISIFCNITYPNATTTNQSMNNATINIWYLNQTYTPEGMYTIVIWANDSYNQYNSTIGYFNITDADPVVGNQTAIPGSIMAGDMVTITVDATDDVNISSVWLNITYPDSTYSNSSMIYNSGIEWILANTYVQVGIHTYVIWAFDTAGQYNSTSASTFEVTNVPGVGDGGLPGFRYDFTYRVIDMVVLFYYNGDTPTTIRWNFGDGIGVIDDLDPSHRYQKVGYYNVTMYVTDQYGRSYDITKQVQIGTTEEIMEIEKPPFLSIDGDGIRIGFFSIWPPIMMITGFIGMVYGGSGKKYWRDQPIRPETMAILSAMWFMLGFILLIIRLINMNIF